VVEQFIFYLAHSPTDTTSPLFLELNTTAMLAALGGPDSGVTIYDTNSQPSNLPFVKLSDSGNKEKRPSQMEAVIGKSKPLIVSVLQQD
jgi:hypothetical protein